MLHTWQLALRPHSGGLLHLEAEDASAAVDLHTSDAELRGLAAERLDRARRTVRGLEHATGRRTIKSAFVPCRKTASPSSAASPAPSGFYVAVTHSGVTLAAHLSRLIAADLTTGTPPAELTPYTPARFTPGIARADGWPAARSRAG